MKVICRVAVTAITPVDKMDVAPSIDHHIVGLHVVMQQNPLRRPGPDDDCVESIADFPEPGNSIDAEQAGSDNLVKKCLGGEVAGYAKPGMCRRWYRRSM
jgi:hypothetical protein